MENYPTWINNDILKHIMSHFDHRIDHYIDKILQSNAKIISFSVHCTNYKFAFELARRIKERDPDRIIIFGGPGCDIVRSRNDVESFFYLKNVVRINADIIDIFVIGDGEIMPRIKPGTPLHGIPGTVIREKGRFFKYGPMPAYDPLDCLPHPTFEEFELSKYKTTTLPILLSRGCINHCAFCNESHLSGRYRCRDPEDVFNEIKYRYFKNKRNCFGFCDLLINASIRDIAPKLIFGRRGRTA